ncbi:hypothetical protein PR048_025360 [Dryococelus australis]|uniref:Uncharacterized protein n=1 Tax=Dryococelus australis TaxID=614101 RepID=A0ABQ9GR62_9NEOP|nr:hypothetical protein PR048_025360 [Dryococelus australis]
MAEAGYEPVVPPEYAISLGERDSENGASCVIDYHALRSFPYWMGFRLATTSCVRAGGCLEVVEVMSPVLLQQGKPVLNRDGVVRRHRRRLSETLVLHCTVRFRPKRTGFDPLSGLLPDFHKWESCRISRSARNGIQALLRSSLLIGSQDRVVKSRQLPPPPLPGSTTAVVVRLFTSHLDEPGSIPGGVRSPDFCVWESCRTTPLVGGVSRGYPVPPVLLHTAAAPFSPRFTLVSSRDHDVNSRPDLSTQFTRSSKNKSAVGFQFE